MDSIFGASTTVFSLAFNFLREYFCSAFVLMRLADWQLPQVCDEFSKGLLLSFCNIFCYLRCIFRLLFCGARGSVPCNRKCVVFMITVRSP